MIPINLNVKNIFLFSNTKSALQNYDNYDFNNDIWLAPDDYEEKPQKMNFFPDFASYIRYLPDQQYQQIQDKKEKHNIQIFSSVIVLSYTAFILSTSYYFNLYGVSKSIDRNEVNMQRYAYQQLEVCAGTFLGSFLIITILSYVQSINCAIFSQVFTVILLVINYFYGSVVSYVQIIIGVIKQAFIIIQSTMICDLFDKEDQHKIFYVVALVKSIVGLVYNDQFEDIDLMSSYSTYKQQILQDYLLSLPFLIIIGLLSIVTIIFAQIIIKNYIRQIYKSLSGNRTIRYRINFIKLKFINCNRMQHFQVYMLQWAYSFLYTISNRSWPWLIVFINQKFGGANYKNISLCFWYAQIFMIVCLHPFLKWIRSRPFWLLGYGLLCLLIFSQLITNNTNSEFLYIVAVILGCVNILFTSSTKALWSVFLKHNVDINRIYNQTELLSNILNAILPIVLNYLFYSPKMNLNAFPICFIVLSTVVSIIGLQFTIWERNILRQRLTIAWQ